MSKTFDRIARCEVNTVSSDVSSESSESLENSDSKLKHSDSETLRIEYEAGKAAFERGDYRSSVQRLESATALINPVSQLGGEVRTWLVTAYQAAGRHEEAIALCRKVTQHPDLQTRQQGKRLLYILEAPQLKPRPEWITPIPDLGSLADSDRRAGQGSVPSAKRADTPTFLPAIDPATVNTSDNKFIWVALGAVALMLGALLWLN